MKICDQRMFMYILHEHNSIRKILLPIQYDVVRDFMLIQVEAVLGEALTCRIFSNVFFIQSYLIYMFMPKFLLNIG